MEEEQRIGEADVRVLMVNKFLYPAGGAETYTFKIGEYLEKQGFSVEYFGMEHPDNVVGNQWGLYAKPLDFHRGGMQANAVNPFRIIRSGEAEKKMERILESFRPHVMHINNFNYQLTPSILEAAQRYRSRGNRLRIIYTAHDPQLVCPNHYLYNPNTLQACEKCLEGSVLPCIRSRCIHGSAARSILGAAEAAYWKHRGIYRVIDTVICPSEYMKRKLDTCIQISSKTVVLRNFVRNVLSGERKKGEYVLYFGRYSEEKGIRTLLDVSRELSDIPFVFAGGGPLEGLIGGMDHVRNVGFLRDVELDKLIQGSRFTVCPSECNENCPFAVIESLMNGKPVLGSSRGGVPELIEKGKTGWLFPAGNREALKKALRRIWDSDEPERMAANCTGVRFDTIEEYGEKLVEIYGRGRIA